ncbi:hypothetical protein NUACC21_28230 [Scytonema sp. NUACC21]
MESHALLAVGGRQFQSQGFLGWYPYKEVRVCEGELHAIALSGNHSQLRIIFIGDATVFSSPRKTAGV